MGGRKWRAAEERLQGSKGNRLGGTRNTGNVAYGASKGGGETA